MAGLGPAIYVFGASNRYMPATANGWAGEISGWPVGCRGVDSRDKPAMTARGSEARLKK
jgi:hypothetical protein